MFRGGRLGEGSAFFIGGGLGDGAPRGGRPGGGELGAFFEGFRSGRDGALCGEALTGMVGR